MASRPLRVLIVAKHPATIRHFSRFLDVFGYETRQATDPQRALPAVQSWQPDFLVLDDELSHTGGLELCRQVSADNALNVVTLLLVRRPPSQHLVTALEAGVDDFLAKPLIHGELLWRLRAGARLLERNRRVAARAPRDRVTNLPSRFAFCREVDQRRRDGKPAACVLLDLDFFDRVNAAHGRDSADAVLREMAGRLHELKEDARTLVACFGGDRFAALLPEQTAHQAAAWAERVRASLSETPLHEAAEPLQLTASFGIADFDQCASGEELVDKALEALEAAKCSGRDCVVRYGEFESESKAWNELATPGRVFERTTARDVMMPCSISLNARDPLDAAARLLDQTDFRAVPVVDDAGLLLGVVWHDAVLENSSRTMDMMTCDRAEAVAQVVDADVPSFEESTDFSKLFEFFASDSSPLSLIVSDGRPTGFVTPESLAALSQPVKSDTFAAPAPAPQGRRYFAVGEVTALAE